MHDATYTHPPTRGSVAAVVLLVALAVVLGLAVLVSLAPAPLGSVGLLALVLGLVGLGAVVVIEGGAQ